MSRRVDSHIWDVQGSSPITDKGGELARDAQGNLMYRGYVNLRVHILAPTMERAIELMREHHPHVLLHQVIKRSNITQVIVDPNIEKGV